MAKKKKLKVVKANRAKWIRGRLGDDATLWDKKGNACCVGIYLKACGMRPEDLQGEPQADAYAELGTIPKQARWLVETMEGPEVSWKPLDATDDASALYSENDSRAGYSCDERKIKAIFKRHGVDFQISGEGHPYK